MKLILAASLLFAVPLESQETRKAADLFKDALEKAKEPKKRVFVTFGGPG